MDGGAGDDGGQELSHGERAGQAEGEAGGDQDGAFAQNHCEQFAGAGAEGGTDAELTRALGNAIGDEAIQADGGESEGDDGE